MWNNRLARGAVIFVIVTAFVWQCIGAVQDSQTTDEAVHLTSGRAYWQMGAWQLNPEHPSLFKLLAAAPLAALPHTSISTSTDEWNSQNQWLIGAQYLYTSPTAVLYGSRVILFLARFPMILIWLGLVITMTVTCWRWWGAWPSVAATTALAYDPNMLAHGHIVTNDVITAFAFLAVCLAARRFASHPTWSRAWWFSIIFGVALVTKFSIIILWLIIPLCLAAAIFYRQRFSWTWWRRGMLLCLLTSAVVIPASYGFKFTRPVDDLRVTQLWLERRDIVARPNKESLAPFARLAFNLTDPSTRVGGTLQQLERLPLPGYWYMRGFFSVASHNADGHVAYLFGKNSVFGWWYYFPVALAVKTPLLTLAAVVICLGWLSIRTIRSLRRGQWREAVSIDAWFLLFPPLMFLLWSMTSHINIGVRHILPTYVFFPFAVAWIVSAVVRHWPRLPAPRLALLFSIVSIVVATSAWPNTFGYFNAVVGGTAKGHRVLLDSNLDWNQDYYRLRTFIRRHHFSSAHVALFGSIPAADFFPNMDVLAIPQDKDIAAGLRPSGIIIVSAGMLYDPRLPFQWLINYQPQWRIGSSIMVYDFRVR